MQPPQLATSLLVEAQVNPSTLPSGPCEMGRAHCRGPEDGRAIWQQLQGVGKSGTLQNRLSQLSQRVIGHNWTKIQMGKKMEKT